MSMVSVAEGRLARPALPNSRAGGRQEAHALRQGARRRAAKVGGRRTAAGRSGRRCNGDPTCPKGHGHPQAVTVAESMLQVELPGPRPAGLRGAPRDGYNRDAFGSALLVIPVARTYGSTSKGAAPPTQASTTRRSTSCQALPNGSRGCAARPTRAPAAAPRSGPRASATQPPKIAPYSQAGHSLPT